jgi:hypothetical protein
MAIKDKKLALAFQFSSAPDDVKSVAKEHADNLIRLDKAQSQCELWRVEEEAARAAYANSNKIFEKTLDAWLDSMSEKREDKV